MKIKSKFFLYIIKISIIIYPSSLKISVNRIFTSYLYCILYTRIIMNLFFSIIKIYIFKIMARDLKNQFPNLYINYNNIMF